MDENLKKIWTTALRSGEYKQAVGVLTRLNYESGEVVGHCCIGVLVEELKKLLPGQIQSDSTSSRRNTTYYFKDEVMGCGLPDSLLEEVGLTYNQQEHLIGLNDHDLFDFIRIADWIDDNV
jgi:hypothetical protein